MSSNNSVDTIKLMLYWQRKALKPSQRKRPRIVSMSYPLAVEKKYALMLRTWMKPLMDFTTDFIRQNGEDLIRGDAAMELVIRCDALPGDLFTRLVDSLNGWMDTYVTEEARQTPGFGPTIWMGLGQAADDLNEANYTQWKKSSKSAMGVEFPKDEEWWPKTKQDWQQQNYTLFEKMGKEYVTQINNVTEQAVVNGWSVRQLVEEISKIDTTMKKGRVNLIARDQIGKLNSMATQARMQNVGLNMYIWETAHDERVRAGHVLMDGLLCRWDKADVYSDDGGKTWVPRPDGAPPSHPGMEIQCFPSDTQAISPFLEQRMYRRPFSGELVEIVTAKGNFRATKNHPIFTDRGWVSAERVNVGDNIGKVCSEVFSSAELKDQYIVPTIEQRFNFFANTFGLERVAGSALDFHGDGIVDDQVDIVNIDRGLRIDLKPGINKRIVQEIFSVTDNPGPGNGSIPLDIFGLCFAPYGIVSFFSERFAFFNGGKTHSVIHTLRAIAGLVSITNKTIRNRTSCYIKLFRQLFNTKPILKKIANLLLWQLSLVVRAAYSEGTMTKQGHSLAELVPVDSETLGKFPQTAALPIEFNAVIDKRIAEFDGHVYNLQNANGWYIIGPGNIIVKNCRCIATTYWEELMGEVDLKIAQEEGKISSVSGEDELIGQKKPASEPIPEKPVARSTKTGIKKDPEYKSVSEKDVGKWDTLSKAWKKELTDEEYTQTEAYTEFSKDINGYLRNPNDKYKKSYKEQMEKEAAGIDSALSKYNLKSNVTVYRCEDAKWTKGLKLGDTFERPEFLSTSILDKSEFSGKELEIRVPAGSRGAYVESVSGAPHEKEFLLKRGTKFKVISNEGDTRIVLEVIDG